MANREEKTFPALPQRRERAREQGQVARSRDLTSAITFCAAAIFFAAATTVASTFIIGAFQRALAFHDSNDLLAATRHDLALPLIVSIAALALLAGAATLGSAAQGGFLLTTAKLAPDLERLNPASYFQRVFSTTGLLELAKAGVKITIIGFAAWSTARWAMSLTNGARDFTEGLSALAAGARRILYWSAAVALIAAVADYFHKRYEYEAELRMTRQEFLDQLKQDEGNPQIKRAIRNARKKNFKRIRGIHQAAAATVVLTNPTHFAVALRYRRGFDQAPLVVAKGAGENAQRIIAIARLAAVPVMENKPLARALFKLVEVGEFIPRQFYRAIAEVLATIMRAELQHQKATGLA
jgi:flagellar biosynthesis protein FlhB